jgi:uncharacterized membrane protein
MYRSDGSNKTTLLFYFVISFPCIKLADMSTTLTVPLFKLTPPLTEKQKPYRVGSIDLLRGLVMIIMALDHTRDYLHLSAWTEDPLNLATTSPLLFFTRWITHFCAPVFVFLAGTSIFFQSTRKTKKELSLFLLKRGFWLVLVEILIINFAFTFDITYSTIGLQTIWAIGISMMIFGVVIWLPFKVILAVGILIVAGHNSLDFYEAGHTGDYSFVYSLLHRPGIYPINETHGILVLYPFLSWVGLIMIGYCFGNLFMRYEGVARRKLLVKSGVALIVFFIILRATNMYGDPTEWATQQTPFYTVLSFINVSKYPPSLLYMCITIGPALLFLAAAEGARNSLSRMITIYGRVPFLYYVLHFFLLHIVTAIFFFASGHTMADTNALADDFPKFIIPGQGYSLLVVYAVWLAVVALLYPVCKWFSEYKQKQKQWWLSYL